MSGRHFVLIHDMMARNVRILKRHGMVKGLLIEWNSWVLYDYKLLTILIYDDILLKILSFTIHSTDPLKVVTLQCIETYIRNYLYHVGTLHVIGEKIRGNIR